ncbi:DNA damage-regulated autophagy modulator protein 2-like isoform X2 [Ornithodoros turicata]
MGTHPPESCIFSQLLNICSLLLVGTVYVRYKQIEQYYRDHLSQESPRVLRLNRISLWLGCVASLGVSIVGNFQETEVLTVHVFGAFLALGIGTLYTWVQTAMSFRMQPLVNSLTAARFRLGISVLATAAFLSTAVTAPLSIARFHGRDKTKWGPDDGGYRLHLASTVSEWLLAFTVNLYILTFVRELHHIYLESPKVLFLSHGIHPSTSSEVYHTQEQLEVPHPDVYFISTASENAAVH